MVGLTPSEVVHHPAYAGVPRKLVPTHTGTVQRGDNCKIVYEIHGTGPKKIVIVSGLGVVRWQWYRHAKIFGHDRGSEYSFLVFDLRGMGGSDKPWTKYSMKMFALDTLAVIDDAGWMGERQLHLIGTSMGGMILQELALLIPQRVASLMFCSTGPKMMNPPWSVDRVRVIAAETLEAKIRSMQRTMIGEEYANSPDDYGETEEGAPLFDTHGDRYVAEMTCMYQSPDYTFSGWLRQAIAMLGWEMTPDDITQIKDTVGRRRILAMHGKLDRAMPLANNEELVRRFGGSGEDGIKLVLFENCGHIPAMEQRDKFAEVITAFMDEVDALETQNQ